MKRKHAVLKPWAVILLVVAALLAVAGVTALYLFLSGRFDDNKVEPDQMNFEQSVSGLAFYENGAYYASGDFKLTLVSSTPDLTERQVTLSLQGQTGENQGYIFNDVIQVQKQVVIGRPFDVILRRSAANEILGGTTVLTAQSANEILTPITAKIFVDKPVSSISLSTDVGTLSGQEIGGCPVVEVDVGSTFDINATFNPQGSENVFGSSSQKKQVFFGPSNSEFVRREWSEDGGHFQALQISDNFTNKIDVYAFKNSYYEREIIDYVNSTLPPVAQGQPGYVDYRAAFNNAVVTRLKSEANFNEKAVVSSIYIKVVEVSVGGVKFDGITNISNMYVDRFNKVTVAGTENSLGASIWDTQTPAQSLNHLAGRLGIKISDNNLKIYGGQVAKVESDENGGHKVSFENYDEEKDYSETQNVTYYVLPNTTPTTYGEYFWQFVAERTGTFTADVAFFFTDNNNQIKLFDFSKDDGLQSVGRTLTLTFVNQPVVTPVWKATAPSQIDMTIYFDRDGNPSVDDKNLSDDIVSLSPNGKFFLYSSDIDNLQDYFVCEEGVEYSGVGTVIAGNTKLYEVPANALLIPKQELPSGSHVNVLYALVRVNIQGVAYKEDGRYDIVATTEFSHSITVVSKLSYKNISSSFSFTKETAKDSNGEFFVPILNRTSSNTKENIIQFSFEVSSGDAEAEKLQQEYQNGNLRLIAVAEQDSEEPACLVSGDLRTPYITFSELELDRNNPTKFTGYAVINEELFGYASDDLRLWFKVVYDDGKSHFVDTIHGQSVQQEDVEDFVLYYQRPESWTGAYTEQNYSENDPISVNNRIVEGHNSTTIKWNANDINLSILNNLLKFTLKDQKGKDIDGNIYKIYFNETNENNDVLLDFNEGRDGIEGFYATSGVEKNTKLQILVEDFNGARVPDFENGRPKEDSQFVCVTFDFIINSEGLSDVKYYNSANFGDMSSGEYVSVIGQKTDVSFDKFAVLGANQEMKDLLQIYTEGEGAAEPTLYEEELTFKFDSTWLAGLTSSVDDLLKMIKINGQTYTSDTENLAEISIANLSIENLFGQSVPLKFIVTDSFSLFTINLTINLKPVARVNYSGFTNFQTQNAPYLETTTDGQAFAVFGDNDYALDEFLNIEKVSSASTIDGDADTYSWDNSNAKFGLTLSAQDTFADYSSGNGKLLYATQDGLVSVRLMRDATGNEKLYLHFATVYTFPSPVQVTLYMNVQSRYTLSAQMRFYVNPNIMIASVKDNYLDLKQAGGATLDNYYTICKITDYIAYKNSEDADKLTSTLDNSVYKGLLIENVSKQKYISIEKNASNVNKFDIDFVDGQTLELTLNQKVEQNYKFVHTYTSGQSPTEEDIKILKVDGDQIFKANDEQNEGIVLQIGYGKTTDLNNIFGNASPKIMTKGGKSYVVLKSGTTYTAANGSLSETSSFFTVTGNNNLVVNNDLSTYVVVGEQFVNQIVLSNNKAGNENKTLNIDLTIDTIITAIGDSFVKYTKDGHGTDTLPDEYNDYGIVMGDAQALKDNNIFQEFAAGAENIQIVYESAGEEPGFHFEANGKTITYQVEIVEGSEFGEIDADKKLTIFNLIDDGHDAYMILKITLDNPTYGKFVVYYRIKIKPNVTAGSKTYPYYSAEISGLEEGEYLDETSQYYDAATGTYTINLDEELNYENSRVTSEATKRFADPTATTTGTGTTIASTYEIVSGQECLAESDIEGENLKLKLNTNSAARIVIAKRFTVNGKPINQIVDGGTQEYSIQYVLLFNQGRQYTLTLTENDKQETFTQGQTKAAEYDSTSGEVTYTFDVSRVLSGTSSNKIAKIYATLNGAGTGIESFSVNDAADKTLNQVQEVEAKDNKFKFSFTPGTVTEDEQYVLRLMTEDREIFRVLITISGGYVIESNTIEFKGGETYNFIGNNGIFSKLEKKGESENTPIDSEQLAINLTGGSDTVENLKKYLDVDADNFLNNTMLTISYLQKDTTFNFQVYIDYTSDTDYAYTFNISLTAKANVQSTIFNKVDSTHTYYAGQTISLGKEDLVKEFLRKDGSSNLHKFALKDDPEGTNVVLVADFISGASETFTVPIKITYKFKDTVTIDYTINYTYTVVRSIEAKTNYPMPNGKPVAEEVLSTNGTNQTQEFAGFFRGTPDFVTANGTNTDDRVYVAKVEGNNTVSDEYDAANEQWRISISSASNVSVVSGSTTYGVNDYLTGDSYMLGSAINTLGVKFQLAEGVEFGRVTFEIEINKVSTTYSVLVIKDNVVRPQINIPQATRVGDTEVIYAEDLASQITAGMSEHLFEQNRLLKLRTQAVSGTKYIRFEDQNTSTNFFVQQVDFAGTVGDVIIDLGKSYDNYIYDGTYNSTADAEAKRDRQEDDALFTTIPFLTARIVATYNGQVDITSGDIEITLSTQQIYTYKLSSSASESEYWLKFTKVGHEDEVVWKKINKNGECYDESGNLLNSEFWVAVPNGYAYEKAYTTNEPESAEATGIWEQSPVQISSGEEHQVQVRESKQDPTTNNFTLLASDYGRTTYLTATVATTGQTYQMGSPYKLKLDSKFSMSGGDNIAPEYEIEASLNWVSLFDTYGSEFGFTYDGKAVTSTTLSDQPGRIALEIYGMDGLKLENQSAFSSGTYTGYLQYILAQDAWNTHNRYISHIYDGIQYKTGLKPRLGNLSDGEVAGSNEMQYLVKSGALGNEHSTGNEIDYVIRAQGASNDGNHIMMRLTYTVKFGDQTLEIPFNLPLKVVPNATVRFKTSKNSALQDDGNVVKDLVIDNQTYVTNYNNMYQMSANENNTIVFVGDSNMFEAKLYGQSENAANRFAYTYKFNQEYDNRAYNNLNSLNQNAGNKNFGSEWGNLNTNTSGDEKWYKSDNTAGTLTALQVAMPTLTLGQRYFYVDFENTFGFKGRIFFTLISDLNPTLASESITLDENNQFEFGSYYSIVSPEKEGTAIKFSEFTYTGSGSKVNNKATDQAFANRLTITLDKIGGLTDANNTVSKVVLAAKLANGQQAVGEEGANRTEVTAGSTIYKTITAEKLEGTKLNLDIFEPSESKGSPEGYTDSCFGDDGWTIGREEGKIKGLDIATLQGAIISVEITLKKQSEETADLLNSISVEYSGKIEAKNYTTDNNVDFIVKQVAVAEGKTTESYTKKYDNSATDKQLKMDVSETLAVEYTTGMENGAATNNAITFTDTGDTFTGEVDNTTTRHVFNFNGISAKGFLNSDLAVDSSLFKKSTYYSQLNNLMVVKAEFYYDGKLIGDANRYSVTNNNGETATVTKAYPDTSGTAEKGKVDIPASPVSNINTQDGISFVKDGSTMFAGHKESEFFVVPKINALLYGEARTISNVSMKVYVAGIDSVTADSTAKPDETDGIAVIDVNNITIRRTAAPDDLFDDNIIDGENVTGNGTIYNDTLEFKLQPGEVVTYAVAPVYNGDANVKGFATSEGKVVFNDDGVPYLKYVEAAGVVDETQSVLATVQTASNDLPYATTIYKSITDSITPGYLTRNLKGGENADSFQIIIISDTQNGQSATAKILYNGSAVTVTSAESQNNNTISTYTNNITLNIDDERALNNSGTTSKRLSFLYDAEPNTTTYGNEQKEGGNKVYKVSQNFTVHKQYTKAEATTLNNAGRLPNLTGYYVVEGSTDKYYIIPLSSWGANINLTNKEFPDGNTATLANKTSEYYQFYFEINENESSAKGSAMIDEFGTITTTSSFQQSDIIAVNIYMKVSGMDGKYNFLTSKQLLGTFEIGLSDNLTKGTVGANESDRFGSIDGNLSEFNLPKGYTITAYGKDSTNFTSNSNMTNPTEAQLPNIVAKVGEEIDLHTTFDSALVQAKEKGDAGFTPYNIGYYVISTQQGESAENLLTFGNLKTLSFDRVGNYTVKIAVHYRKEEKEGASISMQEVYEIHTFEVFVYGDSETKTLDIAVLSSEFDLMNLLSEAEKGQFETSGQWFELSGAGATPISAEDGKYYAKEINGEAKQRRFIARINGVDTMFNVTFYAYSNATKSEKEVVLVQGNSFDLHGLVENSGDFQFFKIETEGGIENVVSLPTGIDNNINSTSGKKETRSYLYYNGTAYKKLSVTYHVVPSGQPTEFRDLMMKKDGDSINATVLAQEIATRLGIKWNEGNIIFDGDVAGNQVLVKLLGDNNNLSTISGNKIPVDTSVAVANIKLLFIQKDGEQWKFTRVSARIYLFDEEKTINKLVVPSTKFDVVANLKANGLAQNEISANATLTFQRFNQSGNLVNIESTIDLQQNAQYQYLVTATEGQDETATTTVYKLDVNFFVESAKEFEITVDLSNEEQRIEKIKEAVEKLKFMNGNDLSEVTPHFQEIVNDNSGDILFKEIIGDNIFSGFATYINGLFGTDKSEVEGYFAYNNNLYKITFEKAQQAGA